MQLQFSHLLVGLSLVAPQISAFPTDVVGRQPLTEDSVNEIMATLGKNDLKLENGILQKRDATAHIMERGALSEEAIGMLISTAKHNKVDFDLSLLDSRPVSEATANSLITALENVGIMVDLSILNKRDSTDSLLRARVDIPGVEAAKCDPDPATIAKTTKYNIDDGFSTLR